MATLRVSLWEYSSIVKNARDLTGDEFLRWALEKWPSLGEHLHERIDIVVDHGDGTPAVAWQSVVFPAFVLAFQSP